MKPTRRGALLGAAIALLCAVSAHAAPPNNIIGGTKTGTLSATGTTDWFKPDPGSWNLDVSGTWSGSFKLERSYDGGLTVSTYTLLDTTWNPTVNVSTEMSQSERNVVWRLNATLSSGSLTWRMGQ